MLIKTTFGNAAIWYDSSVLDPVTPKIFAPDWLQQSGALVGSSQGRNAAYFLHYAGHDMVLRHFWRGGLIGKFNRDLYLRVPVARTRAMQEFMLLQWMRDQGLPVPRPIAARFQPAGVFYRADIITGRIPNSRPMAEWLEEDILPPEIWNEAGKVIGFMHRIGVYHSDLNARNVLIENRKKVWLIDFDKCAQRKPGAWMEHNLVRLKRSFDKEKGKLPRLHWDDDAWQTLLAGYREELAKGQLSCA